MSLSKPFMFVFCHRICHHMTKKMSVGLFAQERSLWDIVSVVRYITSNAMTRRLLSAAATAAMALYTKSPAGNMFRYRVLHFQVHAYNI